MRQYLLLSILLILNLFKGYTIKSQTPTIGLLYSADNISEGYTLFSPENNKAVYLINNCGEKINEWEFSETPGATCYLLENGTLLRAGKDSLEIRDWNNNLLWSYSMTENGLLQHHDIEPLPSGNILCIITDIYTDAEMIANGRDPSITNSNFTMEKIIEIEPSGPNNGNIVWEWKYIDHIIQDFDDTKLNFGIVEEHPELIDINFDNTYNSDWIHLNAIDYNSDLDQIIISSRHLNEIYIIDHSTTTIEAASHTGGNSNFGGDFLWRWGNPRVYRQGDITDQKLFKQHDSKWIQKGYPEEGKITVFNNGGDGSLAYSSIHILNPVTLNGIYLKENNHFLPLDYGWSWEGSIFDRKMLEYRKSGLQGLQNGNVLICETSLGQISEITKSGELIWSYKNPVGETLYNQFDILENYDNSIFRAEKYPPDYPGFDSQELIGNELIENQNQNSVLCTGGVLSSYKNLIDPQLILYSSNRNIIFNSRIIAEKVLIFDLNGKTIYSRTNFKGKNLNINLSSGLYIIQIRTKTKIINRKLIVNH